ncbi:MAG: hypothetical protein IMZ50_08605, partial [Candidatus Atribacteria bacterium]|nr:hypothetical protein [Candidatus Atribacteria bacterium]
LTDPIPPVNPNTVIVDTGHTLTLNADWVIGAISGPGILTDSGTRTLLSAGGVSVARVNVGAGAVLNMGSVAVPTNYTQATASGIGIFVGSGTTAGTLNMIGDLAVGAGATGTARGLQINTGNAIINITGDVSCEATSGGIPLAIGNNNVTAIITGDVSNSGGSNAIILSNTVANSSLTINGNVTNTGTQPAISRVTGTESLIINGETITANSNAAAINLASASGAANFTADVVVTATGTATRGVVVNNAGLNLSLTGDIAVTGNNSARGVSIEAGTATIAGDVTATQGTGVYVGAATTVAINGDVTNNGAKSTGVVGIGVNVVGAHTDAQGLTLTGNLTTTDSGYGVYVAAGGRAVIGEVGASHSFSSNDAHDLPTAVFATGTGSRATITGDIAISMGANVADGLLLLAADGATLTVNGDITGTGTVQWDAVGTVTSGAPATVVMNGNVTSPTNGGIAVICRDGGTVTMTGNITMTGTGLGASVEESGTFTITGNVIASAGIGAAATEGGALTITGNVVTSGGAKALLSWVNAGLTYTTAGTIAVTGNVSASGTGAVLDASGGGSITVTGDLHSTSTGVAITMADAGTTVTVGLYVWATGNITVAGGTLALGLSTVTLGPSAILNGTGGAITGTGVIIGGKVQNATVTGAILHLWPAVAGADNTNVTALTPNIQHVFGLAPA